MDKLLKKLLSKYERTDEHIRKKAIVLFSTTIVLSFILIIVLIIKSLSIEVSVTDSFIQMGFLLGLGFIFTITYRSLLKHSVYGLLLWVLAYFIYLSNGQEILILILIPILFTIIMIVKTSKYHVIGYSIIALFFMIRLLTFTLSNYSDSLIVFNDVLSNIASLLYIIAFCLFILNFISLVQAEIKNAEHVVQSSKIDFVLNVKNRNIDRNKRNTVETLSILLLGVNEFENLNDSLGYNTCEKILKELISLIRNTVRVDDYILRWNQDEFLIVLHQTPLSNSAIVAEKIRKAIEFTGFTEKKKRLTVTICATTKADDQVLYEAVSRAQKGLMKAKTQKKNYVILP